METLKMNDELELLLNNKEQQQHEGYIVTRLIERFDISHKYKKRMYRENKNRFGESFLSLNMFFEYFPTFPARLVLAYPVSTPKVLSVDGLFRNFGGSWLMEDYVYRFRNYVEPGRCDQASFNPSQNILSRR